MTRWLAAHEDTRFQACAPFGARPNGSLAASLFANLQSSRAVRDQASDYCGDRHGNAALRHYFLRCSGFLRGHRVRPIITASTGHRQFDVDRLRLAFQGSLALVLYTVQVRVRAMSAIHTLRYPPPASGSFIKCTSTLHGLTCTKRGLTRDCCPAALPRCNSLTGEIAGVFGAMP